MNKASHNESTPMYFHILVNGLALSGQQYSV